MAQAMRRFAVWLVGEQRASEVRGTRLTHNLTGGGVCEIWNDAEERLVAVFPLAQVRSICDQEAARPPGSP